MSAVTRICGSARVVVTCGTGRRAVVVTIDPARRLGDAIGIGGGFADEPVRVDVDAPGELWVSMLDVQSTFDELIASAAPSPARAAEVLANPFYRGLSQSLSGTRDYMAAARLWALSRDPRFDLVVVDTPPTRNALDFLESPERLARFLSHPLVRILVAQGRGGARIAGATARPVLAAIGRVVGTDALSGVIAFLQSLSGITHGRCDRRCGDSRPGARAARRGARSRDREPCPAVVRSCDRGTLPRHGSRAQCRCRSP